MLRTWVYKAKGFGTTHYPYSNGNSYMLRGIQVELWEPHLDGDSKLATVYTEEATNDGEYGLSTSTNYIDNSNVWHHADDSGYFSFNNIYVGSGGKDVYLRVIFIAHDGGDGTTSSGTEKLVIHDQTISAGWNIPYYQTPTFHISSGEDTGILSLRAPNLGTNGLNDEAAHIYYDIWKTYGYFRDANQYTHGKVDAYIDIADTSSPYTEGSNGYNIHYNGYYNNYLNYEQTSSIIHEYSHSIMWGMYGNSFPSLAPGDTNHGGCANSNSADAVVEGWGRYVPPVIQKDNFYRWGSQDTPKDIDSDVGTFATCGDKEEYVFGGVLYDIRKDIGDPIVWAKYISDTFNIHDPGLVKTFYDGFTSDHGYTYNVWFTFKKHGVDYISLGRSGGPDYFGYTFKDSSNIPGGPAYEWIEINSTGTMILPNSDDYYVNGIPVGFFFNFYGTDYSQVSITNNGITLASGGTSQFTNQPIGSSTPHNFIAPFWDDIVTWGSAGAVYYQTIGTAPNREFVVEWYDNQHF